jgi:pimeloyl-ACP methyl ester carboxylesterase
VGVALRVHARVPLIPGGTVGLTQALSNRPGDDVLDNITLSWLTNTGVSSARLYREYKGAYINDLDISVPAAVSVFHEEVYQAPRSWAERAYHNFNHFNAVAKGGHFAAWEQPQLFSEEVRTGFRSLRGLPAAI